ncbi:MAG: hypothetical protein SFY66_10810 [Oculatellaceae cyanobacterium bins.114]|nr:hypothetical protein [Oculatellaceae cyanobacterium bins.114]
MSQQSGITTRINAALQQMTEGDRQRMLDFATFILNSREGKHRKRQQSFNRKPEIIED